MTTKRKKGRTLRAWAGFVDGSLYVHQRRFLSSIPVYDEPRFAIFPTKRAAKAAYQDVRRVTITVED